MKNNYAKESPLHTLLSLGGGVNSSLYSGGSENYWLIKYGDENAYTDTGDARDIKDETFHGIAIDSDDNIYAVGTRKFRGGGSNNFGIVIVKYDKDGALQWQKSIDNTSLGNYQDIGFSITLDSSNNVYIAGTIDATQFSGTEDAYVARFDSNGTFHWDAIYYISSYASETIFRDVAVDSSGNIYLTGENGGLCQTIKIAPGSGNSAPSSSDILFKKYSYSFLSEQPYSLKFDNSGNFYVWATGSTFNSNGGSTLYKYTNSGTLSQSTKYAMPTSTAFGYNINFQYGLGSSFNSGNEKWGGSNHLAIDSSDNVYVTHVISNPYHGRYQVYLLKLNSSGTVQWQKDFYNSQNNANIWYPFLTVDSSDNLYITFSCNDSVTFGYGACHIIKINSSGTIQWHNVLHGDNDGREKHPHAIISKGDNLYIAGRTKKDHVSQSLDAFIFKIPNDGTLTDTSTGKNGSTWNTNRGYTSISGYEFKYEPYSGNEVNIGSNISSMSQDSSASFNTGNSQSHSYMANTGSITPTINLGTEVIDFN